MNNASRGATIALKGDICDQLESDILYYDWIDQTAIEYFAPLSDDDRLDVVISMISSLVDDGVIVVGDARLAEDIVVIDAWSETGDALVIRMRDTVLSHSGEDRLYCFWIQKREHYLS
ncbi:MAG: hypothetical protein H7A51_13390 [Akkermansiaceae bacterium]|nr:hypothetical protein [Akkermansiaceae bacterium]